MSAIVNFRLDLRIKDNYGNTLLTHWISCWNQYWCFVQQKQISPNESNLDLNNYVSKELYTSEKERSEKIEIENREKEELIGNLKADVSSKNTLIETLNSKLDEESKRLIEQQKHLQTQFENMANDIFEKKIRKIC